jgi:hypothetical protein
LCATEPPKGGGRWLPHWLDLPPPVLPMRWKRSTAAGRPDPTSAPPDPASIARARRIREGRRQLRGRGAAGVVHDLEVEERRHGEAGSGHHATGSGHHATGSGLHGPRPLDPRGEERAEAERRRIRLRERGREKREVVHRHGRREEREVVHQHWRRRGLRCLRRVKGEGRTAAVVCG